MIRLFLHDLVREGPEVAYIAQEADLLSQATYRAITARHGEELDFPDIRNGVVAAGVRSRQQVPEPLLILTPEFVGHAEPGYSGYGSDSGRVREALERIEGAFQHLELAPPSESSWGDLLASAWVQVEPPAQPHWGLADQAKTTAKDGTFGGAVTLPSGNTALLTAGHVTSGLNHPTTQDPNEQGTTVEEEDPFTHHTQDAVCADVAAVTFGQAKPTKQSSPKIDGVDMTYAGDRVDVHLSSGVVTASVDSYLDYLRLEDGNGKLSRAFVGGCVRLAPAVTSSGDSGAAVTRSGGTVLLGHVVGGLNSAGVSFTVVQSIIWQLAALRSRLLPLP
ncbi:hypothetical protein [Streptomyces sp. C10-9-1]|uniref:hypothetical protein n=1 Tax=Streptomyces sp. C10-9-1 TaxID=1859285 RepID=UPI003D70C18A